MPFSSLLFAAEKIPLVDIIAILGRIDGVNSIADWKNLPSTKMPNVSPTDPPQWLPRKAFKVNIRKAKVREAIVKNAIVHSMIVKKRRFLSKISFSTTLGCVSLYIIILVVTGYSFLDGPMTPRRASLWVEKNSRRLHWPACRKRMS